MQIGNALLKLNCKGEKIIKARFGMRCRENGRLITVVFCFKYGSY